MSEAPAPKNARHSRVDENNKNGVANNECKQDEYSARDSSRVTRPNS